MDGLFQSPGVQWILRHYREEGREAGREEEARSALWRVLARRGFAVTDEIRRRLDAERDVAKLEAWHDAAVTSASIANVLGRDSRHRFPGRPRQPDVIGPAQTQEPRRDWLFVIATAMPDDDVAESLLTLDYLVQIPSVQSFLQLFREEGREQGREKEARSALLRVLARRRFTVTDDNRRRVDGERDVARLEAWHDAAVTATSIADVFGLSSSGRPEGRAGQGDRRGMLRAGDRRVHAQGDRDAVGMPARRVRSAPKAERKRRRGR